MKECKRRKQRQEKRHERSIEKHELNGRIQELRQQVIDGFVLCSIVTAAVVSRANRKKSGQKHRKLSLEERQYIYLWRELGYGIREIGRRLARAASTVSRELKRNRPPGRLFVYGAYDRAKYAHDQARTRKRRGRRRVRFGSLVVQRLVHSIIDTGVSPKLASNRLFAEHGIRLSHEAIYQWIYAVERSLISKLYREGKSYKRGGKKRSRAKRPVNMSKLSIEKRPEAANKRLEFGHWEVDCVVSRQSKECLLVLPERVSRFFFVVKLPPNCTAKEASVAIVRLLDPFGRDWLKSLTCDNGAEFWDHHVVSLALEIPVYFCHPYTASERGGVENRNGMLRKFFPKKTDFEDVTDKEIETVRQRLLNRPMECLGCFTPEEIFTGTYQPMFKMAA